MSLSSAWSAVLGALGFLRRNRRQRKAAAAKRRSMYRRHRFDALEQRVVMNADPIAVDDQFEADIGSQWVFSQQQLLGNDGDADDDDLAISSYDAQSALGGSVTFDSATNTFTYDAPGVGGEDCFSYTVTDGNGGYSTASVHISLTDPVDNSPPWSIDREFSVDQDTVLTRDSSNGLLSHAEDADVDTLSIMPWSGSTAQGGWVDVYEDGAFTYTPASGFFGDDSFVFRIDDGYQASGDVQVTIHVAEFQEEEGDGDEDDGNEAPWSDSLYFDVDQGNELSVGAAGGLMQSASDANGDWFEVVSLSGYSAAGGTVDINADGSFHYTPASGFDGQDYFFFQLTDGSDISGDIYAYITVNNTDGGEEDDGEGEGEGGDEGTPENGAPYSDTLYYGVGQDTLLTVGASNGLKSQAWDFEGDAFFAEEGTRTTACGGSVTIFGDGSFEYASPYLGFTGQDWFEFTLSDGFSTGQFAAYVDVNPVDNGDEEDENDAPEVAYTDYGLNVSTNGTYTFSASDLISWFGAADPNGDSLTVYIDIGSFNYGQVVENGNNSYSYNAWSDPGTEPIGVTFDDGNGGSINVTLTFDVAQSSTSPTAAQSTARFYVKSGHQVELSQTNLICLFGINDDDGDEISFSIDDRAGQYGQIAEEDGELFFFARQTLGVDSFTVRFLDDDGNEVSTTLEIEVRANREPTIDEAGHTIEVDQAHPFDFDVNSVRGWLSISDPDGDPLEISLILSSGGGELASNEDGSFTYTPGPVGLHNITVVVTDDDGAQATGILRLNVAQNAPPTASATYATSFPPNGSWTFTPAEFLELISADDADGEELQLTIEALNPGASSLSFDGGYYVLQTGGDEAAITYRYIVIDVRGAEFVGTMSIEVAFPPNQTPIAVDDHFETQEDSEGVDFSVGSILENDSDPEDIDVIYDGAGDPSDGTLSYDDVAGTFTYTPNPDFYGVDSFEYRVRDSEGAVTFGRVYITVAPVPDDVAAHDDVFGTEEDAPLYGNVRNNDESVDGDRPVTLISGPARGTLELDGNGSFVYTPDADFYGEDSFVYEINSGPYSSQATATIVVQAVNDAPTFTAGVDVVVAEDSGNYSAAWAGAISAGAEESAAGQPLSFELVADDESLFAAAPSISADGRLTFRPTANAHGTATVTVRLFDGEDYSEERTFTITVTPVQDAPVADDDFVTTPVGQSVHFEAEHLTANDVDLDDDELNVAALRGHAQHGSVTWHSDGSFTYMPEPGYIGLDFFQYDVTDQQATSRATVWLEIGPLLIDASGSSTFQTSEDTPLSLRLTRYRVGGAAATHFRLSVSSGKLSSDGAAITPSTDLPASEAMLGFTFTPAADQHGPVTLTIVPGRLIDGQFVGNAVDTTTARIQVAAVNDAPLLDPEAVHALTSILENVADAENGGMLVADLIVGAFSDVDDGAQGIAVVAADSSHGFWQYQLASESAWIEFPASLGEGGALLLYADSMTRIRFVPAAGYFSTTGAGPTISFRAWDRSNETGSTGSLNGTTGDASTAGGSMPFSAALGTASIAVERNNPPTFSLVESLTLPMDAGDSEFDAAIFDVAAEPDQAPAFTVTSDNPELFGATGQPRVEYDEATEKYVLKFTPQFAGQATLLITARDGNAPEDGPKTVKALLVTVSAPTFQTGTGNGSGSTGGAIENAVESAPKGPAISAPGEIKTAVGAVIAFTGDRAVVVGENLAADANLRVEIQVESGTLTITGVASNDPHKQSYTLTGTSAQIKARLATMKLDWNGVGQNFLTIKAFNTSDPAGSSATATIVSIASRAGINLDGPGAVTPLRNVAANYRVTISPIDQDFAGTATVNWGDGSPPQSVEIIYAGTTAYVEAPHTYTTTGSYSQTWTIVDGGRTATWITTVTPRVASFLLYDAYFEADPDYEGEGAKGVIRGKIIFEDDRDLPQIGVGFSKTIGDESSERTDVDVDFADDGTFEFAFYEDDDHPLDSDGDDMLVTVTATHADGRESTRDVPIFLSNLAPEIVSDPIQDWLDSPQFLRDIPGSDEKRHVIFESDMPPAVVDVLSLFKDSDALVPVTESGPGYFRVTATDDDGRSTVYEKNWTTSPAFIDDSTNVNQQIGEEENVYYNVNFTSDSSTVTTPRVVFLNPEGELEEPVSAGAGFLATANVTKGWSAFSRSYDLHWTMSAGGTEITGTTNETYGDVGYSSTTSESASVRYEIVSAPSYISMDSSGALQYSEQRTLIDGGYRFNGGTVTYKVVASYIDPLGEEHEHVVGGGAVEVVGFTKTKSSTFYAAVVDDFAAETIRKSTGTKASAVPIGEGEVLTNDAVIRFTRSSFESLTYHGHSDDAHRSYETTRPTGAVTITFHLTTDVDHGAVGTPAPDSDDVTAETYTVTFAEGETVQNVVVKAKYDTVRELDNIVRVVITSAIGVDDELDLLDASDDLMIGKITVVDGDQVVRWGSNNVDTASTGLTREMADVDGRLVDLYDGRSVWYAPYDFVAPVYSDVMRQTMVEYRTILGAGGLEFNNHAEKVYDTGKTSQNDDHGTLLRPWLGAADVGYGPNPAAPGGGYFGFVDHLKPINDDTLGLSGIVLVRRDGSSAWFEAKPQGVGLAGVSGREGVGSTARETLKFTGLVAGRWYYLTTTADAQAAGLYAENGMIQADADGEIEFSAQYSWIRKTLAPTTEYEYAENRLSGVRLHESMTFSTPAGTFGTLRTAAGDEQFRFELKLDNGQRYRYDEGGYLIAEINGAGETTEYDYRFGRLREITLASGATISLRYYEGGQQTLASITGPDGRVVYLIGGAMYSASPQQNGTDGSSSAFGLEVGAPLRTLDVNEAAVESRVEASINPFLNDFKYTEAGVTHYREIAAGHIGRLEDFNPLAEGEARASYTRAHLLIETATPAYEFQFDRFGLITAKAAPSTATNADGADKVEAVWLWERDEKTGLVKKAKMPAGRGDAEGLNLTLPTDGFDVIEYFYDNGGADLTRKGYADGTYEKWEYDPAKNHAVKSYRDRAGNTTKYDLNADGTVNYAEDPLGNKTYYTYLTLVGASARLIETIKDAEDNVTKYEYFTKADGAARAGKVKLITHGVETPEERVETFQYDAYGFLEKHTDVNGVVRVYDYDRLGNLLEERIGGAVAADGKLSGGVLVGKYTYDSAGNLKSTFVPAPNGERGFVTTYVYDAWNQLLKEATPAAAGQHTAAETEYTYTPDGLIETVKDALGHVTTYRYDERRQLVKTIESGASQGVVNRNGGSAFTGATETNYVYDVAGQLKSVADPLDRTTTYTYDVFGRTTRIKNPDPDGAGGPLTNIVTRTEYDDAAGTVKEFSPNPAGAGEIYTRKYFDKAGQLIRMQGPQLTMPADAANHANDNYFQYTAYEYYDNGLLKAERTGVSFAAEPADAAALNADGTLADDDEHSEVVYTYDALARLTATETTFAGSTVGSIHTAVEYEYEGDGLRVTEYDGRLNATVTKYDEFGRVQRVTGPAGAPVVTYDYNADGRLKSVTETAGTDSRKTDYTYDEHGRIRTTTAAGTTTIVTYDKLGHVVEQRQGDGSNVKHFYNTNGQEYRTETYGVDGARLFTVTREFDQVGMQVHVVDQFGDDAYYEYDGLDRLKTEHQPDRSFMSDGSPNFASDKYTDYVYNAVGVLSEIRRSAMDSLLTSTTYSAIDALGRAWEVKESGSGKNRTTKYEYDPDGRVTKLTDADENVTKFEYDGLGRLRKETTGALERTWDYDAAGNLVRYKDRDNHITVHTYDALNRRRLTYVFVDAASEAAGQMGYAAEYDYDNLGRLKFAVDSSSRYDYSFFDERGRPQRIVQTLTIPGVTTSVITYEYEYHDQLTSTQRQTSSAASGYTVKATTVNAGVTTEFYENTYQFDAVGREVFAGQESPDASQKRVFHSYYTDVATGALPSDSATTPYAPRYDSLQYFQASSPNESFSRVLEAKTFYERQDNGLVRRIDVQTAKSELDTTYQYNYDANDLLRRWVDRGGDVQGASYDGLGQLDRPDGYTPNGNPSAGEFNRPTSINGYAVAYNTDGTVKTAVRDGRDTHYEWDLLDRLTDAGILTSDGLGQNREFKYYYDVFNNLIAKVVVHDTTNETRVGDAEIYINDSGSRTLTFRYDASANTRELIARSFYSSSGQVYAVDAHPSVTNENGELIREPLSTHWLVADRQGNVRDSYRFGFGTDGAVEAYSFTRFDYEAWGELKKLPADSGHQSLFRVDPYLLARFQNGHYDSDVEAYKFGDRWLSITLDRWLSEDPSGLRFGTNPYEALRNSPYNYSDPSGHVPLPLLYFAYLGLTAMATGAAVGAASYYAGTEIMSVPRTAEGWAGATVGGAVGGGMMYLAGPANVSPKTQAIIGAAVSYVDQGIVEIFDNEPGINYNRLRDTTLVGATFSAGLTWVGRRFGPTLVKQVSGPRSAVDAVPAGVVYLRTDVTGGLKPYVGKSKSPGRYIARQDEHANDFPDAVFQFQELGRAHPGTALDVAEESWIRQLGGPTNKSNPNGLLSNKRYQMNDVRYRAENGSIDKP